MRGVTTTYGYDDAGRMVTIAYPDATPHTIAMTYDAAGNRETRTDQKGVVATYTYNDLHQLTGRTYTGGISESFGHDRTGRLTSADNSVAQLDFVFDKLGRATSATQAFVGGGSYTTTFDYTIASPNSTRTIHYPAGRQVVETYDKRFRMSGTSGGTGIGVTWALDLANRRMGATMANGVTSTLDLDIDDRLTHVLHAKDAAGLFEVNYGYDAVDDRLYTRDMLVTDHSELYGHDARDRLRTFGRGVLNEAGTPITTPVGDPAIVSAQNWTNLDKRGNWRESSVTLGGQTVQETRTVNGANEYLRLDPDGPSGSQPVLDLEYDDNGNVTNDGQLAADFDDDGDVDLDEFGHMQSCFNGPNRPPAQPNCENADLDSDGDVDLGDFGAFQSCYNGPNRPPGCATTLTTRRYAYDQENRLSAVQRNDTAASLMEIGYDALGRRVETREYAGDNGPPTAVTRHVYWGAKAIEEYAITPDGMGGEIRTLAREFVWGKRFPEPVAMIDHTAAGDVGAGQDEVLHYLHDVLGSVIALTKATGTGTAIVAERYRYDPYGKTYIYAPDGTTRRTASLYGNPFAFTGQRHDAALGLYHFWARTYSTMLGRWLQRDPLGYVDGVSLYEYVISSPTDLVDPYGLECPPELVEQAYQKLLEAMNTGTPIRVHPNKLLTIDNILRKGNEFHITGYLGHNARFSETIKRGEDLVELAQRVGPPPVVPPAPAPSPSWWSRAWGPVRGIGKTIGKVASKINELELIGYVVPDWFMDTLFPSEEPTWDSPDGSGKLVS